MATGRWASALGVRAAVNGEYLPDTYPREVSLPISSLIGKEGHLFCTGEATGGKVDAWYAFAPRWLGKAADGLPAVRGASTALGVLGIAGDVTDMISPQNKGALGWADRGVAATNAGFLTADLVGADLVMDMIPGLGEVAIAATGLYLAGDFLYQHCTPFRDVANDVGARDGHGRQGNRARS